MLSKNLRDINFLKNTIVILKRENPSADLQLLEKTIVALYLLENLVSEGLKFIFKGGTSLVLLLNDLKRFSVDVDIITRRKQRKSRICIK